MPEIRSVNPPPEWGLGPFVLGCGTFGGIGGSPHLVGRGLDERSAYAAMDEAVDLGITLFDTVESYAGGASESMIGRWMVDRDSAVADSVRIATKVAPPLNSPKVTPIPVMMPGSAIVRITTKLIGSRPKKS